MLRRGINPGRRTQATRRHRRLHACREGQDALRDTLHSASSPCDTARDDATLSAEAAMASLLWV